MKNSTPPVADVAETMHCAAETFSKGVSSAVDSWLGAWRRTADTMVGAMTRPLSGPMNGQMNGQMNGLGSGQSPLSGDWGVEGVFGPLRRRSAAAFHALADLAAGNAAELAAVSADQARFASRVAERGFDCVLGPAPAQSTEALGATTRAIATDCMENAAAVSERLVRMGARSMDRMSELLGTPAAAR